LETFDEDEVEDQVFSHLLQERNLNIPALDLVSRSPIDWKRRLFNSINWASLRYDFSFGKDDISKQHRTEQIKDNINKRIFYR
jgi:hypothetical protein